MMSIKPQISTIRIDKQNLVLHCNGLL